MHLNRLPGWLSVFSAPGQNGVCKNMRPQSKQKAPHQGTARNIQVKIFYIIDTAFRDLI